MVECKICGLTQEADIIAAQEAGADYIGFISYEASPRHVSPDAMKALESFVTVKKVAVVVDADDAEITAINAALKPDYFQLHGSESPERCEEVRTLASAQIIKAFKVREADDVAKAHAYKEVADMYLFDSKPPKHGLPGGNGLSFDWHVLQGRDFGKPWMLSGGLTVQNVKEAIGITAAPAVDVSSAVEDRPGKKDHNIMKQFISEAKSV